MRDSRDSVVPPQTAVTQSPVTADVIDTDIEWDIMSMR